VCAVGKLKPKRVLARKEIECRGRLPLAVVEMRFIGWNDDSCVDKRCIDQNMEVPGAFVDFAGGLDDETDRLHRHVEGGDDDCAVGQPGKAHRRRLRALVNDNGDGVPIGVSLQRGVCAVGELKPKRVLARRELERGGRLRLTVVEVLFVGGDDDAGVDKRRIDQNMEVSGAFVDFAGGFDDEANRFHCHLEGRGDGVAVGEPGKAHRRCLRALGDDDCDGVPVGIALERGVCAVGELQPQRMFAGRELDRGGGLPFAVVEILFIGGDDFTGRNEVGIDKDVKVPRAVIQFAGWFDDQTGCSHHDLDRRGDGCAVQGLEEGDRPCRGVFLNKDDYRVAILVAFEPGVCAVGEL